MAVAACLERSCSRDGRSAARVAPIGFAAFAVAAAWTYGEYQLRRPSSEDPDRQLKVALIQGVYDTQFDGDMQRPVQAFRDYVRLSCEAVAETPDLDLVVWPESMFTADSPIVTYDRPLQMIPEWTSSLDQLQRQLDAIAEMGRSKTNWTAQQVGVPLLVGIRLGPSAGWPHVSLQLCGPDRSSRRADHALRQDAPRDVWRIRSRRRLAPVALSAHPNAGWADGGFGPGFRRR